MLVFNIKYQHEQPYSLVGLQGPGSQHQTGDLLQYGPRQQRECTVALVAVKRPNIYLPNVRPAPRLYYINVVLLRECQYNSFRIFFKSQPFYNREIFCDQLKNLVISVIQKT